MTDRALQVAANIDQPGKRVDALVGVVDALLLADRIDQAVKTAHAAIECAEGAGLGPVLGLLGVCARAGLIGRCGPDG